MDQQALSITAMKGSSEKLRLRHLPLKRGLDLTVLTMGLFTLAIIIATGGIYRSLAFDTHRETLGSIIQVQTADIMRELSENSRTMGLDIQRDAKLREALARKDTETLQALVGVHFRRYFSSAGIIKLTGIRIFDRDMNKVVHVTADGSTEGSSPHCDALVQQAVKRSGHQRLKPLGLTCNDHGRSVREELVPIGLLPSGYVSVISDPSHNLLALETMLGTPLRLRSASGTHLYSSLDWSETADPETLVDTRYALPSDEGGTAIEIISQSDFNAFHQRLDSMQRWIIGLSVLATLATMVLARYVTGKIVIEPLQSLSRELRRGGSGRRVSDHDPFKVIAVNEFVELQELYSALRDMALTDSLTGLPNRLHFERQLERLVEQAAEQDQHHALCCLDLDQFKIVNDSCGHAAGDLLLQQLSEVFRKHVRSDDVFARIGGDEFALLLEHCSTEDALRLANQIRTAVRDFRFSWGNRCFSIGVSIGVVSINAESGTLSRVMSLADASCYVAKQQGRNRVHLYREHDLHVDRVDSGIQWASRLQQALSEDRFELFCQPVSGCSRKQRGAEFHEVLVCLREVDGTLVPSAQFIHAAERYSLLPRIDRRVISKAFKWINDNPHIARQHRLSFNLSGYSIMDDQFLNFLVDTLHRSAISPDMLCFEITESAAIINIARASKFVSTLRGLGCSFVLDDFGTGLSSFTYLQSLNVDYLKIDGHFVRKCLASEVDMRVLEAIIRIGHSMHIATIAECVETRAVYEQLHALGVDYAQGFYLQAPAPLEQLGAEKRPAAVVQC